MKYTLYWLCLTISPIFILWENLKVLNSSKSHAMLKSATWNPKSNMILTLAYWLTNCILSDNWEFRCGPAQPQLVEKIWFFNLEYLNTISVLMYSQCALHSLRSVHFFAKFVLFDWWQNFDFLLNIWLRIPSCAFKHLKLLHFQIG